MIMIMSEPMIDQYSHGGFKYEEIIAQLQRCNGDEVSLLSLHRPPRNQNLYRNSIERPVLDIVSFILYELQGSS